MEIGEGGQGRDVADLGAPEIKALKIGKGGQGSNVDDQGFAEIEAFELREGGQGRDIADQGAPKTKDLEIGEAGQGRDVADLGLAEIEAEEIGEGGQGRNIADLGATEIEALEIGEGGQGRDVADLGTHEIEAFESGKGGQGRDVTDLGAPELEALESVEGGQGRDVADPGVHEIEALEIGEGGQGRDVADLGVVEIKALEIGERGQALRGSEIRATQVNRPDARHPIPWNGLAGQQAPVHLRHIRLDGRHLPLPPPAHHLPAQMHRLQYALRPAAQPFGHRRQPIRNPLRPTRHHGPKIARQLRQTLRGGLDGAQVQPGLANLRQEAGERNLRLCLLDVEVDQALLLNEALVAQRGVTQLPQRFLQASQPCLDPLAHLAGIGRGQRVAGGRCLRQQLSQPVEPGREQPLGGLQTAQAFGAPQIRVAGGDGQFGDPLAQAARLGGQAGAGVWPMLVQHRLGGGEESRQPAEQRRVFDLRWVGAQLLEGGGQILQRVLDGLGLSGAEGVGAGAHHFRCVSAMAKWSAMERDICRQAASSPWSRGRQSDSGVNAPSRVGTACNCFTANSQ